MLRNVAGQRLGIVLVDPSTGQPVPGLTVTGRVRVDTAAPALCTVSESANGHYDWEPTQAQTAGKALTFSMTATGGVGVSITVQTAPASEPYPHGVLWDPNGAAGAQPGVNGTIDNPCSAWADAVAVSDATGVKTILLRGTLDLGPEGQVQDKRLVGVPEVVPPGNVTSAILVSGASNLLNCQVENLLLSGVATGTNMVTARGVRFLSYTGDVDQAIDCVWSGTNAIRGTQNALYMVRNVWEPGSLFDQGDPITALTSIAGGGELNLNTLAGATHFLDHLGTVELGAGVTAGAITLTGLGKLTDGKGGTATLDASGFARVANGAVVTDGDAIADAYLDRAGAIDGYTPREFQRFLGATQRGSRAAGFPAGPHQLWAVDGSKVRVTVQPDPDGNITAAPTLDLTP